MLITSFVVLCILEPIFHAAAAKFWVNTNNLVVWTLTFSSTMANANANFLPFYGCSYLDRRVGRTRIPQPFVFLLMGLGWNQNHLIKRLPRLLICYSESLKRPPSITDLQTFETQEGYKITEKEKKNHFWHLHLFIWHNRKFVKVDFKFVKQFEKFEISCPNFLHRELLFKLL